MLDCLNKVVDKIDIFQEDCAKMIFALRRLLGEDQVVNENDFFLESDEDGHYVYKNNEQVLTYNEEGTFAQPKFARNFKLIKEATKFLKKSLKESGGSPAPEEGQQLGGMPVQEGHYSGSKAALLRKIDNYGVGSTPIKGDNELGHIKNAIQLLVAKDIKEGLTAEEVKRLMELIEKRNSLQEEGGTSGADVAVNPNAFEKKKTIKEASVSVGAVVPANDVTATVTGAGKARVNKVLPSKSTGKTQTATVIDIA